MTPTRRSLVLVTVDCLRADHLGFLGYNLPTTPFLDSLAHECIIISNAIVAGAPTYYSFPAIMASRHPLALGRDVIGIAPHEQTLASTLQQAGYATAAFSAGNPYLSRRFGYERGFNSFRDHLEVDLEPSTGTTRSANGGGWGAWNRRLAAMAHKSGLFGSAYEELYFQYCQRLASPSIQSMDSLRRFPAAHEIVDEACSWLAKHPETPVFLWLHLMDPHAPYYPVNEALEQMGNSRIGASRARYLNSYWNRGDIGATRLKRHRDELVKLYDAGIRWVDAQMARVVERLKKLNLWENSIFALTADHGEEFLEHGGRYHPPAKVNEELIRVPLLLRVPGAQPREQSSPFSLVHLAPTLLDSMDVHRPDGFRGRSHWVAMNENKGWDGAAVVECIPSCTNPFRAEARLGARILAVRESRFKLVLNLESPDEQLFDLDSDPGELHPLSLGVEKAVRKRLLQIARDHLNESLRGRNPELSVSARLRDLQREWTHSPSKVSA